MRTLDLALVLAMAAACSTSDDDGLVATLASPTDITLSWHADEPVPAGRVVEFATEPGGRYTILEFLPPERTTYEHRDLMPSTPFYYRLRSYHGPASKPVEVSLPPGPLVETGDAAWATPRTNRAGTIATHPVRTAAAAPTGLAATVVHANGIRFTWTDHARDEEGYLIEVRPAGSRRYGTAAVLDPDVNSAGLVTLPAEKRSTYRVRAFYYGEPSNMAHQTTGAEP